MNKGYTLIELVVAMAVMGLVFALVFSFFLFNYRIYMVADDGARIQYECTELLERLTIDGKESAGFTVSGNVYMLTKPGRVGEDVMVVYDGESGTLNYDNVKTYDNISDFTINRNGRILEIEITGTRKNAAKTFSAIVSMRN